MRPGLRPLEEPGRHEPVLDLLDRDGEQPLGVLGIRGDRVGAPVADAVDLGADAQVLARLVALPLPAGLDKVAGVLSVENLFEAQAGGVAEFDRGGGASERLGQTFGFAGEFEAEVLQAAGDVQGPGLVAEVAFEFAQDGGDGEAREFGAVAGLEAVDGFDQADGGDLEQVVEGFVGVAVAAGEPPREREVTLDQLVTDERIAGRLIPGSNRSSYAAPAEPGACPDRRRCGGGGAVGTGRVVKAEPRSGRVTEVSLATGLSPVRATSSRDHVRHVSRRGRHRVDAPNAIRTLGPWGRTPSARSGSRFES